MVNRTKRKSLILCGHQAVVLDTWFSIEFFTSFDSYLEKWNSFIGPDERKELYICFRYILTKIGCK